VKLYITHAIEVAGETSAVELRAMLRTASATFARALAPAGQVTFDSCRSVAPSGTYPKPHEADDLAAFIAAELCHD